MSARKNPIRLVRGPLTGDVYALTNYRAIDAERDVLEARTAGKHDVSQDFYTLCLEEVCGTDTGLQPLLRKIAQEQVLELDGNRRIHDLADRLEALINAMGGRAA